MNIVFRLITSLIIIFKSIQCHELLLDFLNVQENHPQLNLNLTSQCANALGAIRNGIDRNEVWAIKVQDASGKSQPGFVWGNNFWLGLHIPCKLLNKPRKFPLVYSSTRRMRPHVIDVATKVPVEYRMFYASHTSPIQFDSDLFDYVGLHVGLCFPKACRELEVIRMAEIVFQSEKLQNAEIYGNMTFTKTKTLDLRSNFFDEPAVRSLIGIVVALTLPILIGTCYTHRKNEKQKQTTLKEGEVRRDMNNNNDLDGSSLKKPASANVNMKFLKGFSMQENFKAIMSTEVSEGSSLPSLNGFRAVAAIWIILGHTYFYAFPSTDNLKITYAYGDEWLLQPFFSAFMAVDIFFVLSGFLLAYNFFEHQKKNPSRNVFSFVFKKIFARYVRINTTFVVVMLMSIVVAIFLNDTSQFLMFEDIEGNCKKYWWRNLLFIQNLFPFKDICMTWSWYVAADFQLFVICSILLAISMKNQKLSAIASIAIVVSSVIACSVLGYLKSYNFSLDAQHKTVDVLYMPSYSRAVSYFVGAWAGCYLSKINRQWNVTKEFVSFGWIISNATIVLMSMMMRYGREDGFVVAVLFPGVGKICWSVAISFMILATTTQYGNGATSQFWSAKFFAPFSQISFAAYTLNPLMIMLSTQSAETSFHQDYSMIVATSLGFYFTTYIIALIFMLFIQRPLTHIINMIM